jgi:hypothetical protein
LKEKGLQGVVSEQPFSRWIDSCWCARLCYPSASDFALLAIVAGARLQERPSGKVAMAELPEPVPRSPQIEPKADDHVAPMGDQADKVSLDHCLRELFRLPPAPQPLHLTSKHGEQTLSCTGNDDADMQRCRICFEPSSKEVRHLSFARMLACDFRSSASQQQ